jgi:hypothetical protein
MERNRYPRFSVPPFSHKLARAIGRHRGWEAAIRYGPGLRSALSQWLLYVRFGPVADVTACYRARPLCAICGSWGQNAHRAAQFAGLHSDRASPISIRDIE